METVKQKAPILIESIIPSQMEIRMRMEMNYGSASKLVQGIIAPCAEEAERIICDLVTTNTMKLPVSITSQRHTSTRHLTRKRLTGYVCPRCKYSQIRLDAKYCPGCGKPIEWHDQSPAKKSIKKYQPQKIRTSQN